VIDLRRYPKAEAYLKSHKERLEKRRYLVEAGRQWYEMWAPQDPDIWRVPKVVFPDISPEPRFYIDLAGRLVDGDCYWLTLRPGVSLETLYLLLGVVNASLMSRFHDLAFNNKLYSARRRYMTQYVAKYPYPSLQSPASQKLIALVKQRVQSPSSSSSLNTDSFDTQVDLLVEEAFGLQPDEAVR